MDYIPILFRSWTERDRVELTMYISSMGIIEVPVAVHAYPEQHPEE